MRGALRGVTRGAMRDIDGMMNVSGGLPCGSRTIVKFKSSGRASTIVDSSAMKCPDPRPKPSHALIREFSRQGERLNNLS